MLIGKVETYDAKESPQYLNLVYQDGKLSEPNVEIDHSEFLDLLSHGNANAVGFETIELPGCKGRWETHYWFMEDKVIALATQYTQYNVASLAERGEFISDGAIGGYGVWFRFFRCGCKHTRMIWTHIGETQSGMVRRGICPECGYEILEDSSG